MEKSLFKSFHVELYSNNAEVQVLIILSHHSRPFLFISYKCFRSRIERTNYLHTMYLYCYFLLWYSIFYTFWVIESNSNEYNFWLEQIGVFSKRCSLLYHITKTFSASSRWNISLVRGQTTLPSFNRAMSERDC